MGACPRSGGCAPQGDVHSTVISMLGQVWLRLPLRCLRSPLYSGQVITKMQTLATMEGIRVQLEVCRNGSRLAGNGQGGPIRGGGGVMRVGLDPPPLLSPPSLSPQPPPMGNSSLPMEEHAPGI